MNGRVVIEMKKKNGDGLRGSEEDEMGVRWKTRGGEQLKWMGRKWKVFVTTVASLLSHLQLVRSSVGLGEEERRRQAGRIVTPNYNLSINGIGHTTHLTTERDSSIFTSLPAPPQLPSSTFPRQLPPRQLQPR